MAFIARDDRRADSRAGTLGFVLATGWWMDADKYIFPASGNSRYATHPQCLPSSTDASFWRCAANIEQMLRNVIKCATLSVGTELRHRRT